MRALTDSMEFNVALAKYVIDLRWMINLAIILR